MPSVKPLLIGYEYLNKNFQPMTEQLHSLYDDKVHNTYVDSLMKEQKEDFGYRICTPCTYS
jgi:hypothetical protein